MPSPGNEPSLSDYATDLQRIEGDLADLEEVAFVEPLKSESAAWFAYRLYARTSLNGNLRELRQIEKLIEHAIQCLGPAEDFCLLKANLDFKLHRLGEARRDLRLAPQLAGRRPARMILADIDFQEGRYSQARAALETLAEEELTWDVLARIAHIEGKMGDTDKADQLYLQAEDEITAKEMRSYAWVEIQRGVLDLSRGRVREALAHYNSAELAYSGHWLTAEHIADALAADDQLQGAIVLYEAVLRKVDKPEVQQKLGAVYARVGSAERAEGLFSRALDHYLESARQGEVHYHHHLTEFFADVRLNAEEALKWARKDIALRDNFNTQTALAWALHRGGQSAAAAPHVERALASGVNDADIFSKAAIIFDAVGRHREADDYERRAARLNPLRAHLHVH